MSLLAGTAIHSRARKIHWPLAPSVPGLTSITSSDGSCIVGVPDIGGIGWAVGEDVNPARVIGNGEPGIHGRVDFAGTVQRAADKLDLDPSLHKALSSNSLRAAAPSGGRRTLSQSRGRSLRGPARSHLLTTTTPY